jgi:hypothetical protein
MLRARRLSLAHWFRGLGFDLPRADVDGQPQTETRLETRLSHANHASQLELACSFEQIVW